MRRMQSLIAARVRSRRIVFAALVAASIAALLILAARALSAGGFGAGDLVLLLLFGLTTPWLAVGFWNSVIGLILMRGQDASAFLIPETARQPEPTVITVSTAILMCVRNETPVRVLRNLDTMMADLDAESWGERFHVYILSDTNQPDVAAAEQEAFESLASKWVGRFAVTYRRREDNTGFKAGNVRDFLERWGDRHDFMVTLDADSFMTAAGILRLVGIMQRAPRLGILQSLVIGMPTTSAFARLFQFGMRLGLRSWTIGSAWWQADCGPYWGHNAIVRVAPFKAHCAIQPLAGKGILSGHILSHDQVEAALMRRAGFEVRVLPEEDASFEQNPPTLLEFIRRDLRWSQGNMQYWRLLRLPGLRPMSRVQLALAIQMYLGSPAWIGLLLLGTARAAIPGLPPVAYDPALGPLLLWVVLAMTFAPKIATAIEIFAQPARRRSFGGGARFAAGLMVELVFSVLLAPIVALAQTLFLAGLPLRRTARWTAQLRRDHAVGLGRAARCFWPQTAFGALVAALAWRGGYAWAALPLSCGLLLAIPLAV